RHHRRDCRDLRSTRGGHRPRRAEHRARRVSGAGEFPGERVSAVQGGRPHHALLIADGPAEAGHYRRRRGLPRRHEDTKTYSCTKHSLPMTESKSSAFSACSAVACRSRVRLKPPTLQAPTKARRHENKRESLWTTDLRVLRVIVGAITASGVDVRSRPGRRPRATCAFSSA